eukprot:scaffold294346_cov27-Tisochrysis_lutea.AAC.1
MPAGARWKAPVCQYAWRPGTRGGVSSREARCGRGSAARSPRPLRAWAGMMNALPACQRAGVGVG